MPPAYLKGPMALQTYWVAWWCEGKEPFDSAIIAHGVAGRRNEKTRKVYRCLRCGFWHLGRPLADIRMREWPDGG